MTFWEQAILVGLGTTMTAALATLGWIVTRVQRLQVRVTSLEAEVRTKIAAIEKNCGDRLEWSRAVGKRQDEIAEHLATIKGWMEADRRDQ